MQNGNEEDKVLIIGCSFSQGSYAVDPQNYELEVIESNYGWYDRLSCFKDKHIDVYGLGGCGVVTFATILQQLDSNGQLSQYKTVLIQETTEPRLVLFRKDHKLKVGLPHKDVPDRTLDITHYSTFANYPNSVFSIHPYALDNIHRVYGNNETTNRYKVDLLESPTINEIVEVSKSHIRLLLERHSIKCYVFSLFGKVLIDPYFCRLQLKDNLFDNIKENNTEALSATDLNRLHITRHFSKQGNVILGDLVNTALMEYYYG